jgi:hypothetical protein
MNRRKFFAALALAPVVALTHQREIPTAEFDRRCAEAWYRSRGISEAEVQRLVAAEWRPCGR